MTWTVFPSGAQCGADALLSSGRKKPFSSIEPLLPTSRNFVPLS